MSQQQTQVHVNSGVELFGLVLNSFPSRDHNMILRAFTYDNNVLHLAKERFVASNPIHGPFPQWTPNPIPILQSDGDLDVTLSNRDINVISPFNSSIDVPPDDPLTQAINKAVRIGLDVKQKGVSATNWYPVKLVASDATGNNILTGFQSD